jgi:hypothetical protein
LPTFRASRADKPASSSYAKRSRYSRIRRLGSNLYSLRIPFWALEEVNNIGALVELTRV